MFRLAVVSLIALCVMHVKAQTCANRLWFVLDMSEQARQGSSSSVNNDLTDYNILRSQLFNYVSGLTSSRPAVSYGIISYSGGLSDPNRNAQLTQGLVDANTFRGRLSLNVPDRIITMNGQSTAASHTYQGLLKASTNLNAVTAGGKPLLVVISASGTYNLAFQKNSENLANDLRQKGADLYVIGINNQTSNLNETELKKVAGLQQFQSNNNVYMRLQYYNQLATTLSTYVTNKLCTVSTTPTPATSAPPVTPSPENPCANCVYESGNRILPHPDTCTKFIECLPQDPVTGSYPYIVKECNKNTVFNQEYSNCVWPKSYDCPAWGGKCTNATRSARYAHLCCRSFFQCNGEGNVTIGHCPVGQVFQSDKVCRSDPTNTCLQHPLCLSIPPGVCLLSSNQSNNCWFREYDPAWNITYDKQCPPGTSYSPANCTCTADTSCNPVDTKNDGRILGVCNANMHLAFNNGLAFNDVTKAVSKNWVNMNQVQLSSGNAVFTGNEGITRDIIYIPYYAKRYFPDQFAIAIRFQLNNRNQPEYVLVSNDLCSTCTATLKLYARREQAQNLWRIIFEVTDTAGQKVSINGAASVNPSMTEVKVKVDNGTVSGTINGIDMTSASLTKDSRVQISRCGLSIGQGETSIGPIVALEGLVDYFKFYECSDLSTMS